ncbi:hypothetical protein QE361_003430 [Sphingomonas sp. SORGH_AS802]|uniref:autotransporter outer membrane beta-barrel domain-containing protein n=1 Tax=Sphingomonas sp. SORGH_AS_0802 TaxID=3041800 RepID=UPI00285D1353|nr:autotransporter outer membrane beta-barrel domain-containing protein [Sphingomonas sp. SORGH_AS_0802]MDR6136423.1 hypothetical protein [Sphingomonas sp. SORGH_AS_0802]
MVKSVSQARRVKARALESSAILLAVMIAGPAYAQCAPDPTVVNGTTTCTGSDTDGLRVTARDATVDVTAGAVVSNSGAPAVTIDIIEPNGYYTAGAKLNVSGLIDGGDQAGVLLTRQPGQGYSRGQLSMTVRAGGEVRGANAVVVGREGTGYQGTGIALENSGTIKATGDGYALLSTAPGVSGFYSVVNQAGGFIGAISARVGRLTNAGTIDGGTRSAIDWGTISNFEIQTFDSTNSGTITSASGSATLANLSGILLTNSGTISNTGSGPAITGTSVSLINASGARITSAGAMAIRADTALSLTNAGTITGDVQSSNASLYSGDTVDNSQGTITGNLRFGSSNDTLVVGYANGAIRTGVSGTIDGGLGTDTLRVRFSSDASLSSPIAMPTGFEQLSLAPDAKTTATLADGFTMNGTLQITGNGTVVNRTTLTGTATVVNDALIISSGSPAFINAGTITATARNDQRYAVFLFLNPSLFENSGTITAASNGVYTNNQTRFVNSGTITAGGTAVDAENLTNTGTIRSTGGIGVSLSTQGQATNNGRIEGATTGLALRGSLTNGGTISATGSAVLIDGDSRLVNQAGGVITGGTAAIAPGSSNIINVRVSNAGTINGNVSLGSNTYNNNAFIALPGGVLNGTLTLGTGVTFVTELAGSDNGRFAGINGTVAGTGGHIRLRVRSDSSATLPVGGAFESLGYELFDAAALTLTGAASTRTLVLAGQGSADMTLDIATTDVAALATRTRDLAPEDGSGIANALTITSRGALSLTATGQYGSAAVALGETDRFTNAGTIVARDRRTATYPSGRVAAVSGGTSVTNAGTLSLDGASGVVGTQSIVNSGRIVQAENGKAATGVTGFVSLTNSGTIEVAGPAVLFDYLDVYRNYASPRTIDNSGRIASTGGVAITQTTTYSTSVNRINNLAGGTIAGGAGQAAIRTSSAELTNAGTIIGDVDLGYTGYGGRSTAASTYKAAGGTLTGNLLFGAGDDIFVETDGQTGVTGTIDGGAGQNRYRRALTRSGTVTLGNATATNFQVEEVQAGGADTVATVSANTSVASLSLIGEGQVINLANVDGGVTLGQQQTWWPVETPMVTLGGFTNQAIVTGRVEGLVTRFANSGTIGQDDSDRTAISVRTASFENSGTIRNNGADPTVDLKAGGASLTATNTGLITQGLSASASNDLPYGVLPPDTRVPLEVSLINSGTIAAALYGQAVYMDATDYQGIGSAIRLENSGTIDTSGKGGSAALLTATSYEQRETFYSLKNSATASQTIVVSNSGTIRANGGGTTVYDPYAGAAVPTGSDLQRTNTEAAMGLAVIGNGYATAAITNTATGVIEATGTLSSAILADGAALDLTNAGTIRGGAGTTLAGNDTLAVYNGTPYLAGAVQSIGATDDRIVNTGAIIGSIALGAGNDRIENRGRIEGNVFLGAGDDSFLHAISATLIGTVDGGDGTDTLIVDATGGGTLNGDQFINFERFSQIGTGNLTYAGNFRVETIGISGGTVTVGAGETLTSTGATTITGTDAAETVVNNGTIAGAVALGGGNDRFVNAGIVQGAVALGDGDDRFVEQAGSQVAGGIDGGAGTNTYAALLAGDRSGLGQRSNFQRLAVTGNGTLTLGLDQSFDTVELQGTGLNLTLAGNRVGAVTGSDAAEQLRVDGDIANVALGAGNDLLALGATNAAGRYDGGAGSDTLRFTATGPVVLSGVATGFETLAVAGNALTLTGTLGSAGAPLSLGDGDLSLTVARGGTLAGIVDLGAGNDALRFAAGSVLLGSVAGGAGTDSATLELAGDRSLAGGTLTGFERLATEGTGTLSLTGAQAYGRVDAATDLAIAAGGSLTTGQVAFTGGDQRFTIAGGFAGAVDGGAGTDRILLSGGSAAAPVAFSDVANVEALAMTGGYATVSGQASFGAVALTGGRLVGLAGSTLNASQFQVAQGATFGSAGTVNGNVAVAGILSPGASPGTMTVNGNVALAGGSVSLFELTPTVSDKLLVNGAVTIANGSTLQIVSSGALRPGTSYDLIVASGGISGSYTTVQKPADLFGFLVQRADRLSLLGQFLGDARFSPQVSRSIDYANATLARQPATSSLFAALPALLTGSGTSDARGFAQITPEAYASATQIGVDNALTLTQAARGPAFATLRDEPGAFTFGQGVGQWHRLGADAAQGSSAAQTRGYGLLGGLGYGDRQWMVGAFGGWLNTRQSIAPLGAFTKADGVVAGVHGRYTLASGLGVTASILYDGSNAQTRRALPGMGANGATGRYDLHGLVSDLSVQYVAELPQGWSLTPRAGLTYLRTTRTGVAETGGSPFALTVARDRHVAGFADAGVTFGRSDTSDAAFRPSVTLGARYQIEGRGTLALAGYAGGGLGLTAYGASRAPLVGTVTGGVAYRFAGGLDLFSTASAQTGRDDHQETITTGLRLRF